MSTLYDRIGGKQAIAQLISAFYKKVFTDPLLGPFFVHTSLEKLTQMQEQFFSIALEGPVPEDDISLPNAHQGRDIEQRHLARFTDHLLSTLKEAGIDDANARDIVARISEFSGEILETDPEGN